MYRHTPAYLHPGGSWKVSEPCTVKPGPSTKRTHACLQEESPLLRWWPRSLGLRWAVSASVLSPLLLSCAALGE